MKDFYKNKTILVTGHTGFKGSWLCLILLELGAKVVGYALHPPTNPSLFELAHVAEDIASIEGDIRDLEHLKKVFGAYQPDIVFHMAAQPIVREGYANPVYTYETNVMGTVNLLEAVRENSCVKSVINVTTDKVYYNNEWVWGYRETDALDGFDPYANSKSCSELVTNSYKRAYFDHLPVAVSTCRAGNVIGGGDFAKDRILPDCIRAVERGEPIIVRNPHSIRPYQHVLEPLYAYLMLAMRQYESKPEFEGCYNVGPDDCDCVTTGDLVNLFCSSWGEGCKWINRSDENAVHESELLKLDCAKIKRVLNWKPLWNIATAIDKTVEWSKVYVSGGDVRDITISQISEYLDERRKCS